MILDQFGKPLWSTANESVYFDEDNRVTFESDQFLGADFWNELRERQEDFRIRLDGYTPVAEIPVAVANKWKRQGWDYENATSKEIIARLKAEELSDFIICKDTTF